MCMHECSHVSQELPKRGRETAVNESNIKHHRHKSWLRWFEHMLISILSQIHILSSSSSSSYKVIVRLTCMTRHHLCTQLSILLYAFCPNTHSNSILWCFYFISFTFNIFVADVCCALLFMYFSPHRLDEWMLSHSFSYQEYNDRGVNY